MTTEFSIAPATLRVLLIPAALAALLGQTTNPEPPPRLPPPMVTHGPDPYPASATTTTTTTTSIQVERLPETR